MRGYATEKLKEYFGSYALSFEQCADMLDIIFGNTKSMITNNFATWIEGIVYGILENDHKGWYKTVYKTFSRIIRGLLLGKKGKSWESIIDDELDNRFVLYLSKFSDWNDNAFKRLLNRLKKHQPTKENQDARAFIKTLQGMSMKQLRDKFLPKYLHDVIKDNKSGYAFALSNWIKNNSLRPIFQLIQEYNTPIFCQAFFPTPKTTSRMMPVSSTLMCHWIHRFVQGLSEVQKEALETRTKDVLETMPPAIQRGAKQKGNHKKFSWKDCKAMNWSSSVVWHVALPGLVEKRRSGSLEFLSHVQIGNGEINGLYADKNKQVGKKGVHYGYGDHRLRKTDGVQLSLAAIAGENCKRLEPHEIPEIGAVKKMTHPFLKANGLSAIKGHKGISNLETCLGDFKQGEEELRDVLENHIVFPIDFGVNKEVTGTAIHAEYKDGRVEAHHVPFEIPTVTRYKGSGVDEHIQRKQKLFDELLKAERISLAEHSSRTMELEKFREFITTYEKNAPALKAVNRSEEEMKKLRELHNRETAYWFRILSKLLAIRDQLIKKHGLKSCAPIIVCGNPTFNATMKGKRPAAPKKILDFLSRFFTVLVVDEYLSSQIDYLTGMKMEQKEGVPGFRIWKCADGRIVNKDVAASLCFFQIFCCMMAFGDRPKEWHRKKSTFSSENDNRDNILSHCGSSQAAET